MEKQKQDKKEEHKNQAEEYLNNWKRSQADFENYKKDEAKRMEEFARFANEDLILEALEVVDDLMITRKNLPLNKSNTEWGKGLDNTIRKFIDLFKKYGVGKIDVDGVKFDPAFHEAVEMQEGGTKLEEVRTGYIMRSKVIRPAKVKIVK